MNNSRRKSAGRAGQSVAMKRIRHDAYSVQARQRGVVRTVRLETSDGLNAEWVESLIDHRRPPDTGPDGVPVGFSPPGQYHLLMRVSNPLPRGKPVRFANASQDSVLDGWLTLGRLKVD